MTRRIFPLFPGAPSAARARRGTVWVRALPALVAVCAAALFVEPTMA